MTLPPITVWRVQRIVVDHDGKTYAETSFHDGIDAELEAKREWMRVRHERLGDNPQRVLCTIATRKWWPTDEKNHGHWSGQWEIVDEQHETSTAGRKPA